jgi:hypothetical protein
MKSRHKYLLNEENTDNHSNALAYFTERLADYSLAYSKDGNFYNPSTMKAMSNNEVLCMMRRDYLQSKQPLKGKELEIVLKIFLEQAKNYLQCLFVTPGWEDKIHEVMTE